jgi:hypothetical protein
MSFAMRWLGRLWPRRYRRMETLREIHDGKVRVAGRVEALGTIDDPLTGEACVAIEYRAWPPSTTLGMDGGTTHAGRAFQLDSRQAVEFVLVDETASILVRPAAGEDVAALHRELLQRYGVGLRAETNLLSPGTHILVEGRVTFVRGEVGSPMRADPYAAVLEAERFWEA